MTMTHQQNHTKMISKLLCLCVTVGLVSSASHTTNQSQAESAASFIPFGTCSMSNRSLFERFKDVRSLEITESAIVQVASDAFTGLDQLQLLSLARNNLTTVEPWSATPLNALLALDLRRNAIRQLTAVSFARYPNLQRLHLAVNALEDLDDEGTFGGVPQLRYLNLGRNRLRRIDEDYFGRLERLSHLALHHNMIEYIATEAFDGNARHLRSLRLEGNRLLNLDFVNGSQLVQLMQLNVSGNELESLVGLSFRKDQTLSHLDVSYNRLRAVGETDFGHLSALEHLNISHNGLHTIAAEAFRALRRLQSIDLSENHLSTLSESLFKEAWHLRMLNLSHNALNHLTEDFFADTPHLVSLDLSANRLKTVTAGQGDFLILLARPSNHTRLRLSLRDNRYESVNVSALLEFASVDLVGNPWDCHWLVHEMFRLTSASSAALHSDNTAFTIPLKTTLHFGRQRHVASAWGEEMLAMEGIDCQDRNSSKPRTILVLDLAGMLSGGAANQGPLIAVHDVIMDSRKAEQDDARNAKQNHFVEGRERCTQDLPAVPDLPLPWPKVRLDKFDSRSVIIWMLLGIAVAFAALRCARQRVDKKEWRTKMATQSFTNSIEQKTTTTVLPLKGVPPPSVTIKLLEENVV